jgi:hypothetical protein
MTGGLTEKIINGNHLIFFYYGGSVKMSITEISSADFRWVTEFK